MQQFSTQTEDETRQIGNWIGRQLAPGSTVGLTGPLGAGKTRMVQGIGLGLGIASDSIVSPTFMLCVPYAGSQLKLLHLDAYRIVHRGEIDELGLDEFVEDGGVLVIEWYERYATEFPPLDLEILISHSDSELREISIAAVSDRVRLVGSPFG